MEKSVGAVLQEQLKAASKELAEMREQIRKQKQESEEREGELRREAEEQAKIAEEATNIKLEEAREQLRQTEERARLAEEALEDQKRLATMNEEERLKAEEEVRKRREEELEEERKRREEQEEALRQHREDLEASRKAAEEEEAKRKADIEARLQKEKEDLEAELRRVAAEEAARLEAEEQARLRAEEEEAARLEALRLQDEGATRTRIKVTIVRAEGLRAADRGGVSDPYCVIHMKTKHEDAAHPPFQTDIKRKTLTPVWDQEHTFDAVCLDEELSFEVFDHDDGKKPDSLGFTMLCPYDFRPNGFDGYLAIEEKAKRSMLGRKKAIKGRKDVAGEEIEGARVYVKVEVLPMIRIPKMPRAFLHIKCASHLAAADRGGTSDPYCIAEIPGKPMSRFQTEVKKKQLNPVWREDWEIKDYVAGDNILLQVYDHDRGKALGDPLGSISMTGAQFLEGFNGTLPLEGAGSKEGATLTFTIDVF